MGRAVQVDFLLAGLRDSNNQPLASGKVYHYVPGTTTDKDVYTAYDKSATAAQPVVLDANGKALIYADGAYKFVIKDSADNTLYTHDNLFFEYDDAVSLYGGTSSGGANAYAISPSPSIAAYATGQRFSFLSHQTNTTAATIAVNGLSAKAIVSTTNQALVGGEIQNGAIVTVVYDGTSFRIAQTTPLPRVQQAYSAVAASTSSGTYATITGATVTVSVKTGDYVKISWWAQWSVDNVDTLPGFAVHEGATTNASTVAVMRSTGDVGSGGDQRVVSGSYIYTSPTAGSVTYTLMWRRTAGANVAYSAARYICAEVVGP